MRILYVTNMYPCDTNPNYGIFVKEQIDAIERIQFIEKRIYVVSGQKGFFQSISYNLKFYVFYNNPKLHDNSSTK